MQCVSCSIEIPPNFIKAIDSNVCPSCGGRIIDEATQELRQGLKTAFEAMSGNFNIEGVTNWILSNYQLTKIGSGEPVQFYSKRSEHQRNISASSKPRKNKEQALDEYIKSKGLHPIISNKDRKKNNKKLTEAQMLAEINGEEYQSDDQDLEDQADQQELDALTYYEKLASEDQNLSEEDKENIEHLVEDADQRNNGKLQQYIEADRMQRLEKQQEFMETGRVGIIKRLGS